MTNKEMQFLTSVFHDKKLEKKYHARTELFGGASMAALCSVSFLGSAAKLIVVPK
jgi:hypothetical protein